MPFIAIGAACLEASSSVTELSVRYDNMPSCVGGSSGSQRDAFEAKLASSAGAGFNCTVTLTADEDMDGPVYVYYELSKFYQNHRRYVKSKSDMQLRGKTSLSSEDTTDCKPELYVNGDSSQGTVLPCGLIAWSYFNDTFTTSDVTVDETGIAWDSDADKFSATLAPQNFNTDPATRGGGALRTATVGTDEHFMVWMRTAALPTFRKLYGKIDAGLSKGDTVTFTVENNYNTYRFDGSKKLVLSNASWLGGKNPFLGICYLLVGCLCVTLALAFLLLHVKSPRTLGDHTKLSWEMEK